MWVTDFLQAFVAITATRSYRLARFGQAGRFNGSSPAGNQSDHRHPPHWSTKKIPTVATAARFRSFFVYPPPPPPPPPPAVLTSAQRRDNNLYNRRSQQFVKEKTN